MTVVRAELSSNVMTLGPLAAETRASVFYVGSSYNSVVGATLGGDLAVGNVVMELDGAYVDTGGFAYTVPYAAVTAWF